MPEVHRKKNQKPAAVRTVARTAETPAGLPPAADLLAEIATVLGIEGATYGFAGPEADGAGG